MVLLKLYQIITLFNYIKKLVKKIVMKKFSLL